MKRSHRLVAMTNYFLEHPREHIQLPRFSERYQASKSSISEDLDIINTVFQEEKIGYLERSAGAAGGVRYIPESLPDNHMSFIIYLCQLYEYPACILPII